MTSSLIVLTVIIQSLALEGIVTKAGRSEVLQKAVVELQSEDGAAIQSVVTVDDGRFSFRDLPSQRYRIAVSRAGYVSTVVPVALEAEQTNLRVQLTETAVIHGHVYTREGNPMANATVQALRKRYVDGRQALIVELSTTTNDLGEYRLFW